MAAVAPTTQVGARYRSRLDGIAMRALDVVAALLLLTLTAPVLALIALIVKLESPGGVFFRCRRVGRNGAELDVLKFRKMHEHATGALLTSSSDGRFTRIGSFLARTKLDELPQLLNVVRGEMSLVGPRPEDRSFVDLHENSFRQILGVRPGITGLSQLAFANESQLLEREDAYTFYVEHVMRQKIQIDRLYAERQSLLLNVRILLWTVPTVLLGWSVAVHRTTGSLSRRRPSSATSRPANPRAADEVSAA
jgi:lipopolysaccharide/colanic/teichoic acid biosynthesis glycosyltransferase